VGSVGRNANRNGTPGSAAGTPLLESLVSFQATISYPIARLLFCLVGHGVDAMTLNSQELSKSCPPGLNRLMQAEKCGGYGLNTSRPMGVP
jgi:hypothetical protein